jgi:hypothetical protein
MEVKEHMNEESCMPAANNLNLCYFISSFIETAGYEVIESVSQETMQQLSYISIHISILIYVMLLPRNL